MKDTFALNFFIVNDSQQFAYRRLYAVPTEGDYCVFEERRYKVVKIEWCLDDDACPVGTRINIELEPVN